MLTPQEFLALSPQDKLDRLTAAADHLEPRDAAVVVRLSRALGIPERTIYDWIALPERITFVALAYLEMHERLESLLTAERELHQAETTLVKAREAVARVRETLTQPPHRRVRTAA